MMTERELLQKALGVLHHAETTVDQSMSPQHKAWWKEITNCIDDIRDHLADGHNGMTLRDYFAANVMQSICSVLHQGIRPVDIEAMVRDSYVIADTMLNERDK